MNFESNSPNSNPKAKNPGQGLSFLRLLRMAAHNPSNIKNQLRTEYRRRLGIPLDRRLHPAVSGMPTNLNINLTRRCNLRCEMCIQHRHSSEGSETLSWYDPRRELPLASWVRLMDQVAGFHPTLYVTGGEPTLYPEFHGFIKEAKKRRFLIQLATNGTLLERHSEFLVAQGVELVTVSLDGPASVHDVVRGQPGVFQKTFDGIRCLVATRERVGSPAPIVGLNFAISKENFRFIQDMVPIAEELGVDFLQFQHTIFSSRLHTTKHNRIFSPEFARERQIDLVPPSIPDGEYYESEITEQDVRVISSNLEDAQRQARGKVSIRSLPSVPSAAMESYYLDLDYPFPGQCHSLWKTLRVLPDGSVSPCLHVVAGNITQQAVADLWNGPVMRNFREVIASNLLPGCARCCSRNFT